jgi:large subunit ribosomal protein L23
MSNARNTIQSARITEKATITMGEANAYVFNVAPEATKASIKHDIKAAYNVTPVRVNIVNLPAKQTMRRGRKGKTSAQKKAYVYLKKGDSIAII